MNSRLAALHTIAAPRRDGLRPELVSLLKRSRAAAEVASMASWTSLDDEVRPMAQSGSDLASIDADADQRADGGGRGGTCESTLAIRRVGAGGGFIDEY